MKSITPKKSTSTKTANRTPTSKTQSQQKAYGLSTCTGTRAGVGMGAL